MELVTGSKFARSLPTEGLSFDERRDLIEFLGFDGKTLRVNLRIVHQEAVSAALGYLMAAVLPLHNGLLMHASAIARDKNIYIFAGESGAGKSTIARNSSLDLLHEDRVAVRHTQKGWMAYGLPMVDNEGLPGVNMEGRLKMVGLLEKSHRDEIRPMEKKPALYELSKNVILPRGKGLDPAATSLVLMDLVNDIPVSKVLFRKNSDVAKLL